MSNTDQSGASCIDMLSRLWRDGQTPDIANFIADVGTLSGSEVRDLLEHDQWQRWRRGQRVPAEYYLQLLRNPASVEDAFGLIYGEFLLRQELGESPGTDEYLLRFPQYSQRFREQLAFQKALGTDGDAEASGAEVTRVWSRKTGPRASTPPHPDWPVIDGYTVERELGRGGMGIVYRARDESLGRWVALKVLRAGDYADAGQRTRFRAEAEVVARLQHPNIVQVFQVGEQAGQPFLTLEFVDGVTLAQHCGGTPQAARPAAAQVEVLARAVHYAHSQGVIHRDLKPGNVLRMANETLKITDFGLAKRVDVEKGQTESGVIVGTASYMAPEQAGGRARAVGPAADVYALGAILYELLTGRPPFQGEGPMETVLQVLTDDPVPPSRLLPRLPRELESICLKCLEKDPQRRYPTALALAEDLRRFLAGEVVAARPARPWQRAWKWARRRPAIAALTVAVILVAVAGFGLVTWQWQRAERGWSSADVEKTNAVHARADAEEHAHAEAEARRAAELLSSRLLVDQALSLFEHGEYGHGALSLIRALENAPDDPAHQQHIRQLLDGCRSYVHRPQAVFLHEAGVSTAAISPDGRTVLTGTADGAVRFWSAKTGEPLVPAQLGKGPVRLAAFNVDGSRALTVSQNADVVLWDPASGTRVETLTGHVGAITSAVFSLEGRFLATADDQGVVRVWDGKTGKQRFQPLAHARPIAVVAFRPGGRLLLTAGEDGTGRLWDMNTGIPVAATLNHGSPIKVAGFSRDGIAAVTSGSDGTARLWDTATGRLRYTYRHGAPVTCIAFHPRFASLLTGGTDRNVRYWSMTTESPVGMPLQVPDAVQHLAYNPYGEVVLVGCANTAEVWDPAVRRRLGEPLRHRGAVTAAALSRDGRLILTASQDGTAVLWRAPPERPERSLLELPLPAVVQRIACDPAGRTLLTMTPDGTVRCFEAQSGKPIAGAPDIKNVAHALLSPDGQSVFTDGSNRTIRLWEVSGKLLHEFPHPDFTVTAAAFLPDGTGIVVAGGQALRLWNARTGKLDRELLRYSGEVSALAISPDGRLLLTANDDHTARLWDIATGKPVGEPLQHRMKVRSLGFTPDGQTVVTGGDDQVARLWQTASGKQIGKRMHHDGQVYHLAISPDGKIIATCGRVSVRFWDAATGQPIGEALHHTNLVNDAVYLADGRSILSANRNHVWSWRAPLPRQEDEARLKLWVQVATGMELDDAGGVQYLDGAAWRQRYARLQAMGGAPQ